MRSEPLTNPGSADEDDAPVECSVLMPVLNEARAIEATVSAMRGQRFQGRLEFLIIDGGSIDGTVEILDRLAAEDPRIRVLTNPRSVTPSGLNVGLRNARGRYVARMDGHSVYPPDYLSRGVERLRRGDTRWVSGPQVPVGRDPVSRAVALALQTPLGRGGSRKWGAVGDPDAEHELDSGVFAGVWERATLLEYGGWDEAWVRNQDSEMAGRFLERGERLICVAGMGASYTPRSSFSSLWRQYRQYGMFREKTAVRHPDTLRRSHALPPLTVLAAIASVASPHVVRRPARGLMSLYASLLGLAAVRARGQAEEGVDAILVPVALLVMHFAHGVGFLGGAVRYGPPRAALARLVRPAGPAAAPVRPPAPVYAPSLVEI